MTAFAYPAKIARAKEGGWLIAFRDFPEAHPQAEDSEDVIDLAEGCVQACIEGRLIDGIGIPEPTESRAGEVMVAVPIETATKAALFAAVAASGRSRVALARALEMDEKEMRRMLDPRHSSKLPRIEKVLRALGKELRLAVVDAAKAPEQKAAVRQARSTYRVKASPKRRRLT
jgi:antitoxin HicB